MTKAIDLYIHKLDSGEEVPPVTLEEQSPDLAFIQSQALKGRKTKPVAAKAPAPQDSRHDEKEPFRRTQKRSGRNDGEEIIRSNRPILRHHAPCTGQKFSPS